MVNVSFSYAYLTNDATLLARRQYKQTSSTVCPSFTEHITDMCKGDDRVDIDAVYVYWDPAPGIVVGATVGYVNYDLQYRQYGVHRMGIGELWTGPSITHELGHIISMTHEHQRQDREFPIYPKLLLDFIHLTLFL